jgi:hypothetical protein
MPLPDYPQTKVSDMRKPFAFVNRSGLKPALHNSK